MPIAVCSGLARSEFFPIFSLGHRTNLGHKTHSKTNTFPQRLLKFYMLIKTLPFVHVQDYNAGFFFSEAEQHSDGQYRQWGLTGRVHGWLQHCPMWDLGQLTDLSPPRLCCLYRRDRNSVHSQGAGDQTRDCMECWDSAWHLVRNKYSKALFLENPHFSN